MMLASAIGSPPMTSPSSIFIGVACDLRGLSSWLAGVTVWRVMSKKSRARSAALGAAKAAGGSHLTRKARMATLTRLSRHLANNNYQGEGVAQLGERRISDYFAARKAAGVSIRTMQNEAAHIRAAMRAVGRAQAAASKTISNEALGISGASRKGTKQAPSEEAQAHMLALAATVDPALPILLGLQRHLGLRGMEAIRSGPTLMIWKRQLTSAVGAATIIYGTKGGRRREAHVPNRARALAAVSDALELAKKRGGRLVSKPSLKQAETWYRNAMSRYVTAKTGIQGHALRYAFAQESMARYVTQGYSAREARALTSMDLGHGDGRGRYVAMVYGRTTLDR